MTTNKAAIKLDGNVTLKEFRIAIDGFTQLLNELTVEVAGSQAVSWEVTQLELGSALFGVTGTSDDVESVERIIAAYDTVGQAITENRPIPYSDTVERAARELVGVINGHIKSVIFISDQNEHVVNAPLPVVQRARWLVSIGTVRGELRTVGKNPYLFFSVYDRDFNRAIRCYAPGHYEEILRELWGKPVRVSGTILRDPDTGRPEEVRQIFELEYDAARAPGGFRRAFGILSDDAKDEPSEDIIRRIRNA